MKQANQPMKPTLGRGRLALAPRLAIRAGFPVLTGSPALTQLLSPQAEWLSGNLRHHQPTRLTLLPALIALAFHWNRLLPDYQLPAQ
jgi:hypothetical protein